MDSRNRQNESSKRTDRSQARIRLVSVGLFLVGAVTFSGCGGEIPGKPKSKSVANVTGKPIPEMAKFFTEWFQAHGHSEIVTDSHGVGIANNPTRLRASLYGSKHRDLGDFLVETEFRILLPSGREIVEFVAGLGETEDQAVKDTIVNFTLTTFHVIYKGFINSDDPHMTSKQLEIGGKTREVILGDAFVRQNDDAGKLDLETVSRQVESALNELKVSGEPHWVKLIYSQRDRKPMTVSVTVDNEESPSMNDVISRLDWPQSDGFYILKQFIVIGQAAN